MNDTSTTPDRGNDARDIGRRDVLRLGAGLAVTPLLAAMHAGHAAAPDDSSAGAKPAALRSGADYIVVGAGVAGAVVAARLSEDPAVSVLLIEAGKENPMDIGRSQGAFFLTWGSERNWAYSTVPQQGLGGRSIGHPRGRVVGGSNVLNVGAWLRGRPENYDAWEAAGAAGWNGTAALKAFLAVERTHRSLLRGHDGPLAMNDLPTPTQLSERLRDAFVEAGLGKRGDSAGPDPFVVDRYHTLFVNGVCRTVADTFLTDAVRARKNLTILTRAQVTRVLIKDKRATGGEMQTSDGRAVPDIELLLSYNTVPGKFAAADAAKRSGTTIGVVLLQPKSRGTVRLASRDPMAKPVIDPRYLSVRDDVNTLVAGLRVAQRVAQANVLKPWAETIFPAANASDAELAAFVPGDIGTVYHPVGTVRMGAADDPAAVFDEQLRVKGIAGLRVADASVMPSLIRGHTMVPTVFIGYRAAELIARP